MRDLVSGIWTRAQCCVTSRNLRSAALLVLCFTTITCGSDQGPPSAPTRDFSLRAASSSITLQAGAASPVISVTVNPLGGFADVVNLIVSDLPAGVTVATSATLTASAAGPASIVLVAARSAAVGQFTVRISGTAGALTRATQLDVIITPASTFDVVVSSPIVALRAGTTSGALSVKVVPGAGWTDSTRIELIGLPAVARTTLVAPVRVPSDGNVSFTVSAIGTAPLGDYPFTLRATGDEITRDIVVHLQVVGPIRAWEDSTQLYLERVEQGDTARIVVDKRRGGTIVEASHNGHNFLSVAGNAAGAQTQLFTAGLYDDCLGCSGTYGWSAFQGGTRSGAPNPLIVSRVDSTSLYTSATGQQWVPLTGWMGPIPPSTVVTVEQWVSPVSTSPAGFVVRTRITHASPAPLAAPSSHHFPSIRGDGSLTRALHYGGSSPWTGDATIEQALTASMPRAQKFVATERWVALVDARDQGVTLYSPSSYPEIELRREPISTNASAGDAYAASATTAFPLPVYGSVEAQSYLFVGDWHAARTAIASLRTQPAPDIQVPFGFLDRPFPDSVIAGTVQLIGWALDDRGVTRVEVLVDGSVVSTGTLTINRPDLQGPWPWAPLSSGYSLALDTRRFSDGPHLIAARAVDAAGNSVTLTAPKNVIIANTGPPTITAPPHITVTSGAVEIVRQWASDHCDNADDPDVPARMIRQADGSFLLLDSNAPDTRVLRGPTPATVRGDCSPVYRSRKDSVANTFRNMEWLASLYRDGDVIHALVHNEFHDPFGPACLKGNLTPANPCWYNSITYATSTDGGRTFSEPASPGNVAAAPPEQWDPAMGDAQYGYFSPSNIIRHSDGYYYAFFWAHPIKFFPTLGGNCLMRTKTLADPSSWRAWNGDAFTVAMASPYVSAMAPACTFISVQVNVSSVSWSTYLQRYVAVGVSSRTDVFPGGKLVCGFFFATSADLVHWSTPQLLVQTTLTFTPCGGPDPPVGGDTYPSLIDPSDTTVNFENIGQTAYVYFTRFIDKGPNRDLLRIPVRFSVP